VTYGSLALLVWATAALAQGPIPTAHLARGTLSFDGHSTLGDFVGTTDSVRADLRGGLDLAAVRGWVEAPVATLLTGNGRRDRDLRKSMEVDTFPAMRFDLAGVMPGDPVGDSVPVTLRGQLTIHGVTREVELPARVWVGTDTIRVRSDFPLNLKDHRIGGLSKMLGVLKMHPHIEVHVDLVFVPARAP
jgi:polyisoprenoid-binding protein YceI